LNIKRIYIFEDDPGHATFLMNILSKLFPPPNTFIKVAGKVQDIVELIKETVFPAIFLIDDELEDASGLNILKKINQLFVNELKFTIVMVSKQDQKSSIEALKAGADDFFSKPVLTELLLARIMNAKRFLTEKDLIKQKDVQIQNLEKEISNNRQKMINLLYQFQNSKIPNAAKITSGMQKSAPWIASKLTDDMDIIDRVKEAARFAFIGKMNLPDTMVNTPVMTNGFPTNEKMNEVPKFTREILSQISDYEDIVNVIEHIYENFDGSGIPNKIKGWEIPLESRIIRVLMDYDYFLEKNSGKQNKAIDILFNDAHRVYDFQIIAYLDQYLAHLNFMGKAGNAKEIPMLVSELIPGQTLSRNIFTSSGLKLISAGTRLNEETIHKILSINKEDSVIGSIYIFNINN